VSSDEQPEKLDPEELKATLELVRLQAITITESCNEQCERAGLLPLLDEQQQVCGAAIFAHLLCVMGITAEDIKETLESELPIDKKRKK
jgi:hypothetical protein